MILLKTARSALSVTIALLSSIGFVFDGSASVLVRAQKFLTKKIEGRA